MKPLPNTCFEKKLLIDLMKHLENTLCGKKSCSFLPLSDDNSKPFNHLQCQLKTYQTSAMASQTYQMSAMET